MSTKERPIAHPTLHYQMALVASEIDRLFDSTLAIPPDGSGRLIEAIRYAAIGAGKRLRPLLPCAVGDVFDVPRQLSLGVGSAVECVHPHSLIHDGSPRLPSLR